MVKERPLLFSGDMVRAIIGGRKTQTRRVVKYAPEWGDDYRLAANALHLCPYGVPGERLWVRETWRRADQDAAFGVCVRYNADGAMRWFEHAPKLRDGFRPDKSIPSIHMPRWASRLTLELTGVRVERLQAISEEDARAEGVLSLQMDMGSFLPSFEGLWDSINSNRGFGWDTNPWVWVLEFRRVTP